MNFLQPNKFIVLSKRLWKWLPDVNGKIIDKVVSGKLHSTIWEYSYKNFKSRGIGVCHPSWMFGKNGNIEEWKILINKFLE